MSLLIIGILGTLIGSFLNATAMRLVRRETWRGRSYCRTCNHLLYWYELIPLLSFVWLRGSCRHCHGRIGWRYPTTELATAVIFILTWFFSSSALGIRNIFFVSILFLLVLTDWEAGVLPDVITLPAIVAVGAINVFLAFSWISFTITALVGALFFAGQYWFSRKKWVGSGDIRLGALIGFMVVQLPALLLALMVSYIVGAVVALIGIATGRLKWHSRVPFAPFMAFGTWIILIFGDHLLTYVVG